MAIYTTSTGASHLLEARSKVLPVPAVGSIVELGASELGPLVIVVLGATVQELTVDGGSSSDGHTENDGGGAVVDAGDGRRADDETAGTAAILCWVEVTDGALDLAVLNDEDGPCSAQMRVSSKIFESNSSGVASQLTLGESSRDTVSDGQTGGTTTDNDKVIVIPKLSDLPLRKSMGTARESLDNADEDGRANGESLDETHLFSFLERKRVKERKCWVVYRENEYPTEESLTRMNPVTLEERRGKRRREGSSS